jgi:gas vesicle protein
VDQEENTMTRQQFWQGMGIGIVAGTVVGLAIQPRKKTIKDKASRAMRAMGGAVENNSDSMGM